MQTVQAKDLTKEFPRSPYEELGGFTWLGRLIDKVRALNAGTLGDYTPYPCGGDQRFLAVTGLDTEALKAEITRGASDAEIVEWARANAVSDWEARMVEYRKSQFQPVTGELAGYLEGAKAELAKARPQLDLSGVDNFSKLICAEEGYTLPSA